MKKIDDFIKNVFKNQNLIIGGDENADIPDIKIPGGGSEED